MVFTAATAAANAEKDQFNDPGMCLQQTRIWAGIGAKYPDAATAWRNTNDRHPGDKNPPRGAAVFWTGGSRGFGHIALSLGGGNVRSTDAGGNGRVATRNIDWFETNWGQHYAGWSWDINEVTIVHVVKKPDTPWGKTRKRLIRALSHDDAKAISPTRKKVHAFIKETKKELAELPKR